MNEPATPLPEGTGGTSIRRQLIWSALFPLAFFGLLSALVIAAGMREITLAVVRRQNTALVQVLAARLADEIERAPGVLEGMAQSASAGEGQPSLPAALRDFSAGLPSSEVSLFLVSPGGLAWPLSPAGGRPFPLGERQRLAVGGPQAGSQSGEAPDTGETAVVSYSRVPGTSWVLLMADPWENLQFPAASYQWVLAGLLSLGTVLSLQMLSLSIGRVSQPIAELASSAGQAVPGSVFHPLEARGPLELRMLTQAFNQMVIRLAEQQGALRQYAHQALLSQEEERQRISHELHDETVQDLVGLVQRLELCRNEMDRDPQAALRRLDELQALARRTLEDVRRISNALRPSILQDIGLPAAIQSLCAEVERALPHTICICEISGDPLRLSPDLELAAFRVAQEALSNVRRHANSATEVHVRLDVKEAGLCLAIGDNGPGFDVPDLKTLVREGHLGLAGMYERARLFGGRLELCSQPGQGTSLLLEFCHPNGE